MNGWIQMVEELEAENARLKRALEHTDKDQTVFKEIALEIAGILDKKNADYGSSYDLLRGEFGETSFLIRLGDKYHRIKQLVMTGERRVVDEPVEDTIKDIIGYCILELAFRAKTPKNEG